MGGAQSSVQKMKVEEKVVSAGLGLDSITRWIWLNMIFFLKREATVCLILYLYKLYWS